MMFIYGSEYNSAKKEKEQKKEQKIPPKQTTTSTISLFMFSLDPLCLSLLGHLVQVNIHLVKVSIKKKII